MCFNINEYHITCHRIISNNFKAEVDIIKFTSKLILKNSNIDVMKHD